MWKEMVGDNHFLTSLVEHRPRMGSYITAESVPGLFYIHKCSTGAEGQNEELFKM